MLIKCKESFRHQITKGDIYLVIEMIIRLSDNSIFYRVIDNEGYTAIYEFEKFYIVSNEYKNSAVLLNDTKFILSHKDILNSSLNEKNIEGFWGCFIEDDVEAIKVVNNIVKELSLQENIEAPQIII